MKFSPQLLRFLRGIVIVAIIGYGAYYVYSNLEAFRALENVNSKFIIIMIVFILINIFASASENAVLFQALGAPIGNLESFGLTNVSSFLNLILPQGGTITKAMYLKQKYRIPYSRTPAMYLGLLVIYLMVGSGIMFTANLITLLIGKSVPFILWLAAGCAGLSGMIFMVDFPKESLSNLGRIGVWISNYSDGWKSLRTSKSSLLHACLWQFIIFISSGVWVTMAYYSLGIKIDPLLGTGLSILNSFTNILVIIPGNFGIQEAVFGYFTYLTGTLFAQGVVVSALIRIVLLLVTLLLAPISWFYLFYKQNIKIRAND